MVGAGVTGAAGVGAGVGVAAAVGAGVAATGSAVVSSTGADVAAVSEEAAVVGLTVVAALSSGSSPPPQPWIAKKALNARRESTNARPVILKIANSHNLLKPITVNQQSMSVLTRVSNPPDTTLCGD
jgi:hypothetical protein